MVHNHFTLNNSENRYKCKYCNKSYKVSKDKLTSSLKKHLQVKHNNLFSEIDQVTNAMNRLEILDSLVYILFCFILFYIHIIYI